MQVNPWIKRKGLTIKRFAIYLFGRFKENKLNQRAAILSYTTLLSLVPFLAVCFSLITAFPVFKSLEGDIKALIINNLVATSRDVVQQYIETFVNKASNLTVLGICGVIVTALLMMSSVDSAMNRIWRVKATRHKVYEFVIYWAVLTLGPLLIGVSFVVTSYVFGFLSDDAMIEGKNYLIRAVPFIFEMTAFALMYIVLPNRRVKIRHALTGAALAAALFEVAKKLFAYFVANFTTYQAIYGAMAAIPVFLLWIYLSWIIVLFGAEFAHALGSFRDGVSGRLSDPSMIFVLAIRIIGHLWRSQRNGKGLNRGQLLVLEPSIDERALVNVTRLLSDADVITQDKVGNWVITRDISNFTVYDLYGSSVYPLPSVDDKWMGRDDLNKQIALMIQGVGKNIEKNLSVPVKELFLACDKNN